MSRQAKEISKEVYKNLENRRIMKTKLSQAFVGFRSMDPRSVWYGAGNQISWVGSAWKMTKHIFMQLANQLSF